MLHEIDIDKLIRDFSQTAEDIRVRNLKYEIDKLRSLMRQTEDAIIKRQIELRIKTKQRSLDKAEVKARQKLESMTNSFLQKAFNERVKAYTEGKEL